MKKISSLILAFMMLFALSVSSFADTEVYSGGGKITVEPGEEKVVRFTGNFSGPFYIAFGDQGQVMWRGLESGTKDFSFNLTPVAWVIEKHPDVQFINFPAAPSFTETATVQFTIPVNDAVEPSLYMLLDNGTIVGVPDVKVVGSNNKKFEFKTSQLAETYIISDVDLSYEMAPVQEPDPETPTEPGTEPSTPENPGETQTPGQLEKPDKPAPQTGIEDTPYIMMVVVGVLGMFALLVKKRKD